MTPLKYVYLFSIRVNPAAMWLHCRKFDRWTRYHEAMLSPQQLYTKNGAPSGFSVLLYATILEMFETGYKHRYMPTNICDNVRLPAWARVYFQTRFMRQIRSWTKCSDSGSLPQESQTFGATLVYVCRFWRSPQVGITSVRTFKYGLGFLESPCTPHKF